MTLIHFEIEGVRRAAYLWAKPVVREVDPAANVVSVAGRRKITLTITGDDDERIGQATRDLDPGFWAITEPGDHARVYQVPEPSSIVSPATWIEYADLTEVDPATLDPLAPLDAAWVVALDALSDRVDNLETFGVPGNPGKSAYQVALDEGYSGTVDQWLASLEGSDAYEVAVANGYSGNRTAWLASLVGAHGDDGDNGESAYQLAVDAGFSGNLAAWLASLHGTTGKSAYQSALDNGFSGNEQQWIVSLKGIQGDDAYQVAVGQGFSGNRAAWLASLVGLSGKSAYQLAVDLGYSGSVSAWLASLVGLSAYQVALGQGFSGTVTQWLATLVGKSAYQLWLDNGHTGTLTDYENFNRAPGISISFDPTNSHIVVLSNLS